jgi:hypothetical protein
MMGGGGGYKPDTTATKMRSDIARDQYEQYKKFYRPIEDQAFNYINNQEQQRADVAEAAQYADTAFDAVQGASKRSLGRYGISPSAEAQKNFAADTARDKTLAGIDTKNRAREAVGQRVDSLNENMINIGKGVQSGADQTMNSWVQLQNMNNQSKAQDKAASAANRNMMIGTGASIVASAMMA